MSLEKLEKIYRAVNVSSTLHDYNYACRYRLTKNLVKMIEKEHNSYSERKMTAVKLGFVSGFRHGMFLCDDPFYDSMNIGLVPAYLTCVASSSIYAFDFNYKIPLYQYMQVAMIGVAVSAAMLVATLATGSGTPTKNTYFSSGYLRSTEKVISQYGILGVPQWAAVCGYNSLKDKSSLTAAACLIAASLLGAVLEPMRCTNMMITTVARALAMLFSGINTAIDAFEKTIKYPNIHPIRLVDGLEDILNNYPKDFFGTEPKPGEQSKKERTQRPNKAPHSNKEEKINLELFSTLNDETSKALALFQPVINAKSKKEKRLCLEALPIERTNQAIWYDTVEKSLCRSMKPGSLSYAHQSEARAAKKRRSSEEIDLWWLAERKNYYRFALGLHPDKLNEPGFTLSPDLSQLTTSAFNLFKSSHEYGKLIAA